MQLGLPTVFLIQICLTWMMKFIISHQWDVGCLVNGFGQEISAPVLGVAQQAVRGRGTNGH
uniref:Uncharacterized protein n=1 Tax=Romanomermis culicivorax TaxID=13658 RepID=A0A915JB87_ROMCU